MTEQRTYNSPLREEQARRTREQILDALVDLISDVGSEELNIKDLASRAGVSERTIYRHFPDRQALRDGLFDSLNARTNWPDTDTVRSVAAIASVVATSFRTYDANERSVRALVLMNLDPARTASESRRHVTDMHEIVAGDYPHLTEDEVVGVSALVNLLVSSRTWLRFHDAHDLPGEESARFTTWVLDLIRRELDAGQHVPELPPEPTVSA